MTRSFYKSIYLFLQVTIILNIAMFKEPDLDDVFYPKWAVGLGWIIAMAPIITIAGWAMYIFCTTGGYEVRCCSLIKKILKVLILKQLIIFHTWQNRFLYLILIFRDCPFNLKVVVGVVERNVLSANLMDRNNRPPPFKLNGCSLTYKKGGIRDQIEVI